MSGIGEKGGVCAYGLWGSELDFSEFSVCEKVRYATKRPHQVADPNSNWAPSPFRALEFFEGWRMYYSLSVEAYM